jgi:ribonuclease HI
MRADRPQYLLITEVTQDESGRCGWQFSLRPAESGDATTAADFDAEASCDRLELLAAVRGLEALGQPARIKLVTRSRYVRRGISRELEHWRQTGFRWERFGRLVPIRDQNLWRRIDRALGIHEVVCGSSFAAAQASTNMAPAEMASDWIQRELRGKATEPWSDSTLVVVRTRRCRRNVIAMVAPAQPPQNSDIWNTTSRPELSRSA